MNSKPSWQSHFECVFGEREEVNRLTDFIEIATNFEAPVGALEDADTIAAFAFGWRRTSNGNALPGPLNELLAKEFVRLAGMNSQASLYAQHEIGELALQPLGGRPLSVVFPELDSMTMPKYLTTNGGWIKMTAMAGQAGLGRVAVVAHSVHAHRVCWLGRRLGIDCFVPKEATPISEFDNHETQQPWCRAFLPFVLHSMVSTLVFLRSEVLKTDAPSTKED